VIGSNSALFGCIWRKSSCISTSSAYFLSHVMTDPVQRVCDSHLAIRNSIWYRVLGSECRTPLTFSWPFCSDCCRMINAQMHWRVFRIYHYDRSITAYSPITVAIQRVEEILSTFVRIGAMVSLVHGNAAAFAGLWAKYWCTRESWAYCYDRSSTAYLLIPFGSIDSLGNIEYLCLNMWHGLICLWQSRSFCMQIM